MKIKPYLSLFYLPLLLLMLVGCQMLQKTNRKPQSAGSTAYCSNCLVKNVDKNLQELQKALQVNNKLPANLSSEEYSSVPVNEKCPRGYAEGIKYHDERYPPSSDDNFIYFNRMKCLSKDMLSHHKYEYYVHTNGKCAKRYVKGKQFRGTIYRGQAIESFILCTHKNKLHPVYEVDVYGKCATGYVEGRKRINKGNYNSMNCIHKDALPGDGYAVHADGECAEGYAEGRRNGKWVINTSYAYIDCWHKSKLGNKYDTHADGECAEGYVEMATNDLSTNNKRCVLRTVEK